MCKRCGVLQSTCGSVGDALGILDVGVFSCGAYSPVLVCSTADVAPGPLAAVVALLCFYGCGCCDVHQSPALDKTRFAQHTAYVTWCVVQHGCGAHVKCESSICCPTHVPDDVLLKKVVVSAGACCVSRLTCNIPDVAMGEGCPSNETLP